MGENFLMNRLFSVCLLTGLFVGDAIAASPSYVYPDSYGYGGYPAPSPVVYGVPSASAATNNSPRPHTHDGMYLVARAELSFLNWENKYDLGPDVPQLISDKYSFKPVFGGDVAFGTHFGNTAWRGEIEAGYVGFFKDNDYKSEFSLSVFDVMANAYYDFASGVYLGVGAGAGIVTTKISGTDFEKTYSKNAVVPMGGLMLGWTHRMDEKLVLDLRYRLAGIMGTKQRANLKDSTYALENKIDFILDNSLSIGLRYEF